MFNNIDSIENGYANSVYSVEFTGEMNQDLPPVDTPTIRVRVQDKTKKYGAGGDNDFTTLYDWDPSTYTWKQILQTAWSGAPYGNGTLTMDQNQWPKFKQITETKKLKKFDPWAVFNEHLVGVTGSPGYNPNWPSWRWDATETTNKRGPDGKWQYMSLGDPKSTDPEKQPKDVTGQQVIAKADWYPDGPWRQYWTNAFGTTSYFTKPLQKGDRVLARPYQGGAGTQRILRLWEVTRVDPAETSGQTYYDKKIPRYFLKVVGTSQPYKVGANERLDIIESAIQKSRNYAGGDADKKDVALEKKIVSDRKANDDALMSHIRLANTDRKNNDDALMSHINKNKSDLEKRLFGDPNWKEPSFSASEMRQEAPAPAPTGPVNVYVRFYPAGVGYGANSFYQRLKFDKKPEPGTIIKAGPAPTPNRYWKVVRYDKNPSVPEGEQLIALETNMKKPSSISYWDWLDVGRIATARASGKANKKDVDAAILKEVVTRGEADKRIVERIGNEEVARKSGIDAISDDMELLRSALGERMDATRTESLRDTQDYVKTTVPTMAKVAAEEQAKVTAKDVSKTTTEENVRLTVPGEVKRQIKLIESQPGTDVQQSIYKGLVKLMMLE